MRIVVYDIRASRSTLMRAYIFEKLHMDETDEFEEYT